MSVICLLQARMSSTRLPGKVLMDLLGQPMILHQLKRIKRSNLLDDIIVATSSEKTDDDLAGICRSAGFKVYRGSLGDMLDRFTGAIQGRQCSNIVRLTADCPLIDPYVIDDVIRCHLDSDNDYTSNTLKPTYPDGLDVEVFKTSALISARENATLPSEREHATPYIYNHPEIFSLRNYENTTDLSSMRWTVDEPEDFSFVSEIYSSLYEENPNFTTSDILRFLSNRPEVAALNSFVGRNEGYAKSLVEDQEFLLKIRGK